MKAKLSIFILGLLIAAGVAVGVWWLEPGRESERIPADGGTMSSRETAPEVSAEDVEAIVGRWRRTDGGYVIDVRGLDAAGNLRVAYYNPRPINVSQAQVVKSSAGLHVFVELRDQGYPGATYRLDYNGENDALVGIYHQPALQQSFDVVFLRE